MNEDTVALLCAAARKWARWDARFQAIINQATPYSQKEFLHIANRKDKWRDRTLSYGHHLLSAPVKRDDVWTPADVDKMMAQGKPFATFNRICIDPAAEMKRLDTLVQQLCARVANLEEASG